MRNRVVVVALAEAVNETSDLRRLYPLLWSHGVPTELWGWGSSIFGRVGYGGSRRSLAGRLGMLAAYSCWFLSIVLRALRNRTNVLYYCVMFEAALPIAIAGLLKKTFFVFANMDNAPLRCPWKGSVRRLVECLERFVARKALIHKLPTALRWESGDVNVRFVENAPTRGVHESALRIAKERGYQRDATLTVYANGWLSDLRGLATLVKAIGLCKRPIRVILAGRLVCPEAESLAGLECCEYLGVLPHEEALAVYAKAHLVFTYYDPALAIDRLASSGKWSECVLFKVPFVVNSEVETVGMYREAGACFSTAYGDAEGLSALLDGLSPEGAEWQRARAELSKVKAEYWDEGVISLLREAGLELLGREPTDCPAKPIAGHKTIGA